MSAPAASIPQRLGEFRVVGLLGEGAFGTVYEAEREVAAGAEGPRRVALKVLRADLLPSERQRKQFLHEATLLAGVDHPGVVRLVGFGLLPDDRPYLAMERLEGETLAAALARGALPGARALALFAQLTDAVTTLHARGLVHRDVKPENIYLVDGGARAVLFDFGIAKGEGTPVSTMTQDGAVRGTPAYMAPERFFGAPATVGSEVYELAVCLYAMLAGSLPWADAGDPESRLAPRPLSAVGAGVSAELEAVIMRALSTRAEKRPASVAELAALVAAAAAPAGAPAARRTLDLPAESAAAGGGLPRAPTTGGGAAGAPGQPTTGGPVILGTGERPPRRRTGTMIAVFAGLAAAGGVGAVVGRMAWSDGHAAAPDAAPEPSPTPTPTTPEEDQDPRPVPPPGPRRDARTTRVPADVWKHHPADTAVLVGVSWTQALAATPVAAIISRRKDKAPPRWYKKLLRGCGFDLVSELEWLTFGVGADAKGKDFDVIVSGRWTRDELEPCLAGLLTTSLSSAAMERHGRTTAVRYGGNGYTLGWIDDHTVLFSTRAGVDQAWVEARLDGKDGGATRAAALTPLRDPAFEAGTIWVVARPGSFAKDPFAPGVPVPEAMAGGFTMDDDLSGELTWRYADEDDAVALIVTADKSLAEARQDPSVKLLLGQTRVERKGKEVKLIVSLDAKTTAAFLDAMIAVLAVQFDQL